MSYSNQPVRLNNYEKARAQMLIKHPFFAAVVLSTEWVERANDPRCPTACTDMVKVYYNPAFINELKVEEAMFVLVHEIMHMILMHGLRRGRRKPRRWNHACDYAINQELVDAGLTMPEMGLIDKAKYQGMAAEQIYDILEKDKNKDKNKGKGKGKGGKPGQGQPGEPDDDDDDEDIGLDDLLDALEGKSQSEINDIKEIIKQKIAQAATMARAAGKMPANIDLLVDGVINPPQRWEVILREFMTRMVQSSETWNRRNRRYASVTLPSRQDVGMGELCIIGDTSGSMMIDSIFAQIATEINYCNEFVKPERTRVVWADDEACSNMEVFEEGEEVTLNPKGGGGTDMRKPLHFIAQYDPCCVILITDCYTPWPSEPTPYPLIVASTTDVPCPDWALRLQLRVNE